MSGLITFRIWLFSSKSQKPSGLGQSNFCLVRSRLYLKGLWSGTVNPFHKAVLAGFCGRDGTPCRNKMSFFGVVKRPAAMRKTQGLHGAVVREVRLAAASLPRFRCRRPRGSQLRVGSEPPGCVYQYSSLGEEFSAPRGEPSGGARRSSSRSRAARGIRN